MPVDVQVETTIARAPEVVSSFAGDPTNTTQWYANIRSVTWKTPPPVPIGSLTEFEAHFLGRRLVSTYEVTELVPDSGWSCPEPCLGCRPARGRRSLRTSISRSLSRTARIDLYM